MPLSRLDRAIIALARAHRRRAAHALAPIGLHPGQDALMTILTRRGTATQAQLARILQIEPPTLAVMVRRLEAAGFVTRDTDPDDGRVKIVTPTDRGRAAAAASDQAWEAVSRTTREALAGEDVDEITRLLERLAIALGE